MADPNRSNNGRAQPCMHVPTLRQTDSPIAMRCDSVEFLYFTF